MFTRTVELYKDGWELEDIAFELNYVNVEEVIEDLRIFRDWSKVNLGNGKRFTFADDLKDVIADRFMNGGSTYSIKNEFDISSSTVAKIIREKGIDMKGRVPKTPDYKVIHWKTFEVCPDCGTTKHVRELGTHNQEVYVKENRHSFCLKCNTEWYVENGETRQVVWMGIG